MRIVVLQHLTEKISLTLTEGVVDPSPDELLL